MKHNKDFSKCKSIRQDKLTEEARDVIAWALACNICFMEDGEIHQIKAVEVQLKDTVEHLYEGGMGVCFHSPKDSLDTYQYMNDEDWAVIFAHDCTGNPERGMAIVQVMSGVEYAS